VFRRRSTWCRSLRESRRGLLRRTPISWRVIPTSSTSHPDDRASLRRRQALIGVHVTCELDTSQPSASRGAACVGAPVLVPLVLSSSVARQDVKAGQSFRSALTPGTYRLVGSSGDADSADQSVTVKEDQFAEVEIDCTV